MSYTLNQEAWISAARGGGIGLWHPAFDIRSPARLDLDDPTVMRLTTQALRPLLEDKSLSAATLNGNGSVTPWPGTIDEQLSEIESGWRVLGRAPLLGDICWLVDPGATTRRWEWDGLLPPMNPIDFEWLRANALANMLDDPPPLPMVYSWVAIALGRTHPDKEVREQTLFLLRDLFSTAGITLVDSSTGSPLHRLVPPEQVALRPVFAGGGGCRPTPRPVARPEAAADSKRSWSGLMERRALLLNAGLELPNRLPGTSGAAPDDVVDAAAAAWTAGRIARGEATSLPSPPELLGERLAAIWF